MFLRKCVLKICCKFTGEHPCRSALSINLQSNFIEIVLRHECSPVNLLHIFRTPFSKNTSGRLFLKLFFLKFGKFFRGSYSQNTCEWLFLHKFLEDATIGHFAFSRKKTQLYKFKQNHAFCDISLSEIVC